MSNFFVTKPINVALGESEQSTILRIAKLVGLPQTDILSIALKKQSVDARDKGNVHFVCSYLLECKKTHLRNALPYIEPQDLLLGSDAMKKGSCIVVGGGPSGLFLAMYLARNGVKVTVVEQGGDISARQSKVKNFFEGGKFDEKCNVQFGLGGAGTFSDGKLTTGISSPLLSTVFNEFVRDGAPKEILTAALPHIGTDNLVNVVANMRDKICKFGGEFLFDTTVTQLIVKNGRVTGVVTDSGELFADAVALCCGHSAHLMFHELVKQGVTLETKPFAVGLRVEHTREFINKAQYGEIFCTHRDLGAATYKLVHNEANRSCYSFCMCPGGVVVPSNSECETVVTNGMSNFARNAPNSNSALVVTVNAADIANYGFGTDPLCGVRFQQHLEQAAYMAGGGNYKAPCQNVTDFLSGRVTAQWDISPSYARGVTAVNFDDLLPQEICETLKNALWNFNRKIRGFAECGILTGVETRTSSPVKIVRNQALQSNICGLFPAGEGGGHAGGIVSSAVDGLKVAQAIVEFVRHA